MYCQSRTVDAGFGLEWLTHKDMGASEYAWQMEIMGINMRIALALKRSAIRYLKDCNLIIFAVCIAVLIPATFNPLPSRKTFAVEMLESERER